MSSDLNTSTMKSPPLEDCVTDSLVGGWVSAASCAGPGTAALRLALGATACACAAAGVNAAAPTRPAPLRKLRRARVGESLRRLRMGFLLGRAPNVSAQLIGCAKSRAAPWGRQGKEPNSGAIIV